VRLLRAGFARIVGFITGHRAQDELNDEMQAHLDLETAEYIRRGWSPDEARRRALAASGGLTQAAEAVRDQAGLPWIDHIGADIRYAFRSLQRSVAFTAVVVVTLALGIGANTAIFSVVRGVLLKPLPHRGGDRLIYLRQSSDGPGRDNLNFSVPEIRDLREGVTSFSGLAQFSSWGAIHQTNDGPMRIDVGLVTGNYFDVMGLSAILGRVTQSGDDRQDAERVAVLTHNYWTKRFGGDSGIVGTTISLDRRPVTVIGVLQPAPFFPDRVEMLLNLVNSEHHMGASMQNDRSHRMTEIVARLRPTATLDQARAEVGAVYSRLQNEFREAYPAASRYRVAVIPFQRVMGERARLTLMLLMASAVFVLIVSAANVANLTLMRGVRREPELVVRVALGAGVGRLRRLLLVENLTLTLIGALLGVIVAKGALRLLTTFAERYSTRANDIQLDVVVFGFTLVVSIAVALVLSFLASLPQAGTIGSRISAGAQRVSASLGRVRVQRGLVVVQIAVTVMLLAGAGLLNRTMIALSNVDTGLSSDDVLTMQVSLLSRAQRQDSAVRAAARDRLRKIRDEIAALPGVTDVGIGGTLPLRNSNFTNLVEAEGMPLAAGEAPPRSEFRSANPDYFRAAGIPIVSGRAFTDADEETFTSAIINQTLADRFWPNEDPVGRRIGWKMDWRPDTLKWLTVVGVVGNTRDGSVESEARPVLFTPMSQLPTVETAALVIRFDRRMPGLAASALRIVRRIDPTALTEHVMTIAQFRAQSVSPRRLNAVLISSFSILAVVIAAVGIGGVLAFAVGARTNEIGIRMSLGANSGSVQWMILKEGGALVLLGLALGTFGAFVSAGIMRQLLYGVEPRDPATYALVVTMMAAIGIFACWIPALRAARIDPAITMRS
jgi:predicted permease